MVVPIFGVVVLTVSLLFPCLKDTPAVLSCLCGGPLLPLPLSNVSVRKCSLMSPPPFYWPFISSSLLPVVLRHLCKRIVYYYYPPWQQDKTSWTVTLCSAFWLCKSCSSIIICQKELTVNTSTIFLLVGVNSSTALHLPLEDIAHLGTSSFFGIRDDNPSLIKTALSLTILLDQL